MKVSKYNYIYEYGNKCFLLNLLSGALIEVDKMDIKEILSHNKPMENLSIFEKEDIEILKEGNFILEEEINEMDIIKLRYRKSKYNNETLKLTIIPTYRCNFNCTYCYQRQLEGYGFDYDKGIIDEEILNSLEVYLKGITINKKQLHIEWFGGEPTLVTDLIVEFNHRIKDICEENDCIFTSSIVTNGYLLDEKTVERLYKSGVKNALITVDGPKEIHDKRRILRDGSGTYDKIMNNLVYASKFMEINLRINIDKQNNNYVTEFVNQLERMDINKRNINVLIVPTVVNENDEISKIDERELLDSLERIYTKLIECDLNCKANNIFDMSKCAAKKNNAFIVDVDGRIFKCSSLTGYTRMSDGQINLGTSQLEMNYNGVKWLIWEPFEIKECYECKYLPICYGGCIYNRFADDYKADDNIPKHMLERNKDCKKYYDEFLKLFIKQQIYINNNVNREVV